MVKRMITDPPRALLKKNIVIIRLLCFHFIVLMTPTFSQGQNSPTVTTISECNFSNGSVIAPCKIAYLSFGQLNTEKDNAVLVTTWLLGRSEDWIPFLGQSGIVDTTKFYVIIVDALGNGRSQSVSNSTTSDQLAFNALTIGDMVQSQYRLFKERLGINKLHAVIGASMGGMQAFEWAVRYPSFAKKVVSIIGTPKVGSYDRLLWTTLRSTIDQGLRYNLPHDSIWLQLTRIEALHARTPTGVNQSLTDSLMAEISGMAKVYSTSWSLYDYRAKLGAMIRHDVYALAGGDMKAAAAKVKAKMLLIYSPDDHMVTANEGISFGRLTGAEMIEIPSSCGHLMFICESQKVGLAVRKFLNE
jgi:homoserine O-acetyltransferase/O-succinyltransferase